MVVATFLLLSSSWVAAAEVPTKLEETLIRQIGKRLEQKAFAHGTDFSKWPVHVAAHRAAIDAAATERELGLALTATLAEFGVSHLWIWTPEELRLRREGRQGGAGLKTVNVDAGRLVTMVLPDGAAERAGLRRGDLIVRIDAKPAAEGSLAGELGEERHVVWRRGEIESEVKLVLSSARRAAPPSLRRLESGLAWLTVPTFSFGVYDEAKVDELFAEAVDAPALVLDLRSNGGGRSDHVEHLLAHVLPAGTAVFGEVYREDADAFAKRRGREATSVAELLEANGQTVSVRSDVTSTPYAGPLAVLVDRRSGSGADAFPAAIQDAERGIVVGTETAGAILSGNDHELKGGYVLFYPQGETVRLSGERLEANPVRPDVPLTPMQTVDDRFLGRLLSERLLGSAE